MCFKPKLCSVLRILWATESLYSKSIPESNMSYHKPAFSQTGQPQSSSIGYHQIRSNSNHDLLATTCLMNSLGGQFNLEAVFFVAIISNSIVNQEEKK